MATKCRFYRGLIVGSGLTFILFQFILNQNCKLANDGKLNNILPMPSNSKYIFNSKLCQNDSQLIQIITNEFLVVPSTAPYHLISPLGDPAKEEKQTETVLKLLKQKKNGFFVESGANDGEYLSSTLVLERDHGWTGLLVEPDPYAYADMLKKNRKAWKSPVCLSILPYPQKVSFSHHSVYSVLSGIKSVRTIEGGKAEELNVTCLPVFSLLAALNITSVDYFCLDVEGAELKILRTIPFDSIFIKVFSIEFDLIPEGKDALKIFMETKGYVFVTQLTVGHARDYVFIHKSLKDNIKYIFQ